MSWFGAKDASERKFTNFEDKTIDEQADEITRALIYQEENPLFEFDTQDEAKRRDLTKSLTGAGIFIILVNMISLRQINKMPGGKTMGPMRKSLLLIALDLPFYWYFYNDVTQNYMDLKKHLVTRYLISGDEILYKRPVGVKIDGRKEH